MKLVALLPLLVSVLTGSWAFAEPVRIDGMYVNTFGDRAQQALIFVHGGPGYNSWDFELTTAQRLADRGYYVVVYDERGQGRSDLVQDASEYTYAQYSNDLKKIIDTLGLKDPVLLGHSHGGPISIHFDQDYPGVAKKIVLMGAPLNLWGLVRDLLDHCAQKFTRDGKGDELTTTSYIYGKLFIEGVDGAEKEQLIGAAFNIGLSCGLYSVAKPTAEATALRDLLRKNPIQGANPGHKAMPGFLTNEDYVHFLGLEHVLGQRARFCGLYGDEDGLFSALELGLIRNVLGGSYRVIPGASHAVYIDQQGAFFEAIRATCGL